MTHVWLRNLFALIVAGLFLAGCQSAAPEETPAPPQEVEDVQVEPTPPPPPPKRTVDDQGNPLDADERPLSRVFYFDLDRSVLSPRDLGVLQMHADFLRSNRGRSIVLEGHCDERGTREYNLALGERRADAARSYLTSSGVRGSQIETVSYGEERPANPGHNESAWSKNRRVEMHYR